MFGWLAKLLMTSPIAGSGCACCEGKKKRLEKMQEAIANGGIEEEVHPEAKLCFSSGAFSARINSDGSGEVRYAPKLSQKCNCGPDCQCGDDEECHCGKGDDCCKKTGRKNDCHCHDDSHCSCRVH